MNLQLSIKRKRILIAAATVMAAMLFYPPWRLAIGQAVYGHAGYAWLWAGPSKYAEYTAAASVNVSLLLMQWMAVVFVAGVAFVLANGRPDTAARIDQSILDRANAEFNKRSRWRASRIFWFGAILGAISGWFRGGNSEEQQIVTAILIGLFWGGVFVLIGKASHWIEYRKALRRAMRASTQRHNQDQVEKP